MIEGLRTDSLMWGNVRVSQALSVLLLLCAGAALLIRRLKTTKLASVVWSAYFVADCGVLTALYILPILCKLYLLLTSG